MDYKLSLSLGIGLLSLVGWRAIGTESPGAESPDQIIQTAPVSLPVTGDAVASSDNGRSNDRDDVAPDETSTTSESLADPSASPDSHPSISAAPVSSAPVQPESHRRSADDTSGASSVRGRRGQGQFGSMTPAGSFAGMGKPQFTEEDVERAKPEAEAFWEKNSPERFKTLQGLPAGRRAMLETATTRLYLNFQETREKDPELFNVIVNRVQAEDKVFAMVADLKKTGVDARSSKPLRDAVTSLVQLNLKERHLRLDQLVKTLKEQQETLKTDEDPANFENLVNQRVDTELADHHFAPVRYRNRSGNSPSQ